VTVEETVPIPGTAEPGPRRGWRWNALRLVATVALLAVAALLGANATANTTLVFAAVMLVAALPLINGRPVTWIALAVALPWTSRLFTIGASAPRILDFMDFPLVLVAFLFAGVRYLNSDRRLTPAQRRICRLLLVVTVVIILCWAFNDLYEPQRLVAGWVLALEPFLLLVAVIVTPMTARERKMLLIVTTSLLCGQLLFSLAEILLGAVGDSVKGSLLAAGAGHHVSAGGLALGFFILAKQRVPKLLTVGYGALALFVIVVADAKQVLFILPLTLLVLGISGRRRRSGTSLVGGLVAGSLMAAASVYALLTYHASSIAFDFIDRSATNGTGKVAVAQALWGDISSTFVNEVFGLGPGESVSRFAFLTTPTLLKQGSPVALLGLHASRGADHYNKIAFSGPFTGNSSFTSALSSALGILGDYGVAGVAAFGALILAVIGALLRAGDRQLRSSALASWTLLLPLAFVFDWLEQPPFTLSVMVITGLAIRGESNVDPGSPARRRAAPDPLPTPAEPRFLRASTTTEGSAVSTVNGSVPGTAPSASLSLRLRPTLQAGQEVRQEHSPDATDQAPQAP
jgi:hypothetical protein